MKLGIGSYTLTWSIGVPGYAPPAQPLTALGLLEEAHAAGITLVQFADNLPLHELPHEELLALRSRAETLGVSIEVGTRGTDPAHLREYVRLAQFVGSPLCRTLITTPDLTATREQLAEVLPDFQAAGVLLAVENHGLHTTEQLVSLFDDLNHPNLGCCLDTVNSFGALESPDTVIRALMPYTVHVHIKDFAISRVDHQMGFVILGTPAGAGRLDLPVLLAEARRNPRCRTAVLELWTPFTNTVEETVALERQWLAQSIDHLHTHHFHL